MQLTNNVQLWPLVDAVPASVSPTWSFPAIAPAAWQSVSCSGLDAQGQFSPNLGCFLVQLNGMNILIDAGIGPGPNQYLGGLTGNLPARLAEIGVSEKNIDLVVFTHLHMDHIGWAGSPGDSRFPNAPYVAPERDAAFFAQGAPGMGEHHRAAYAATMAPLIAAGRVDLLPDGAEIAPGIKYLATPGHTPGHQSVLINTGSMTLAVTGDVFHCPAQIEQPDWSHRADHDPALARKSRHEFLKRAVDENWILAAGHFRAQLQFGRAAPHGEGLRFIPEQTPQR